MSIKTTAISMAIAISVTYAKDVSEKCIDELAELPNTKQNFNMASLPQDLATAVLKVQGGAKFQSIPVLGGMLGPGPDTKLTDAGITVGCAKEMPTDPAGIKSLLTKVGLEMGKSAVASKLGVSKDEVPNNLSELKGFAIKTASLKAGQALGIEESEMPTDIKGVENLVSAKVKKQAAEKLGVEESSIPNNKNELSGFIKKSAKAKIASELGIKPSEVSLSSASLAKYANENEALAPIANLANAANVLEVLGLVNSLSAFTGGGIDDGGGSTVARVADDDETEREDEDEKPAKKSFKQKDDDDDEKPAKKAKSSDDESMKFGIRLAYLKSITRSEGENYGDLSGHGGELGLVAKIPISGALSFNPGLNLTYRTPISCTMELCNDPDFDEFLSIMGPEKPNKTWKMYEYVIGIPLMFQLKIDPIYLEIGVQADIPVKAEEETNVISCGSFCPESSMPLYKQPGTYYEDVKEYRASADFSAAVGLGFNISESLSLGLRASMGLNSYFPNNSIPSSLLQGSFGITYLF